MPRPLGTYPPIASRKPAVVEFCRTPAKEGAPRADLASDGSEQGLRVEWGLARLPAPMRKWFADDGRLTGVSVEESLAALEKLRSADLPELRLSQEIAPWLEARQRRAERKQLRHA